MANDSQLYITAVKSLLDNKVMQLLISYDCFEKASVLLEIGSSVKFVLNGKRVHVVLLDAVEKIDKCFLKGCDHLLIVPSDPLIIESLQTKLSDKKYLQRKFMPWASCLSIGCAIDLDPIYYSTAFNLKKEMEGKLKFTLALFDCQLSLNIFLHNNDRNTNKRLPVAESRGKINIMYDCIKSHVLSHNSPEAPIDLALFQYDKGNNEHWNEVSSMALIEGLTDVVHGGNNEHVRTYYNNKKLEVIEFLEDQDGQKQRIDNIKYQIMDRLGPELSAHSTNVRCTLFEVKKSGKPIMLLVANVHNKLHNLPFIMSILSALNKIKARIVSIDPDRCIDIIVGGDWNISHTTPTDMRKLEELNEFSLPPLFKQPQSSQFDYMLHTTSAINIFRQYEIAKTAANLGTANLDTKAINDHWPVFATCFIKVDNAPAVSQVAAASNVVVPPRTNSQTMMPRATEHRTSEMLKYYTFQLQQIKQEQQADLPYKIAQPTPEPFHIHHGDPVVGRTATGLLLYKGPRGGIYHISQGGYKQYHPGLRGGY